MSAPGRKRPSQRAEIMRQCYVITYRIINIMELLLRLFIYLTYVIVDLIDVLVSFNKIEHRVLRRGVLEVATLFGYASPIV